jgi:hypothetical protein
VCCDSLHRVAGANISLFCVRLQVNYNRRQQRHSIKRTRRERLGSLKLQVRTFRGRARCLMCMSNSGLCSVMCCGKHRRCRTDIPKWLQCFLRCQCLPILPLRLGVAEYLTTPRKRARELWSIGVPQNSCEDNEQQCYISNSGCACERKPCSVGHGV